MQGAWEAGNSEQLSGNRSHPLLFSSPARRQAPDSSTMCALARELTLRQISAGHR